MSVFDRKKTGLVNFLDYKKKKVKFVYWLLFIFLLIIGAVCLIPPIWVILSSLKDIKEFYQVPPTIIPKTFHIEKLVESWNLLHFGKIYLNTFEMVAGAIIFSVLFNGAAGYVISRLKPKGHKIIFAIMLWTLMLPNSVSMVTVFKNIVKVPLLHINLVNTYWPLFFMAGANAFFVLIFKSFFDGIPSTLIEAARIDGCSDFSVFFRIIMPLSKPVIVTVIILQLSATWGDFFWPYLILKDPNRFTVMVKVYSLIGTQGYSADIQMASIAFAILPPAILFIFFQKYIVQGVTMSGIKG